MDDLQEVPEGGDIVVVVTRKKVPHKTHRVQTSATSTVRESMEFRNFMKQKQELHNSYEIPMVESVQPTDKDAVRDDAPPIVVNSAARKWELKCFLIVLLVCFFGGILAVGLISLIISLAVLL